MWWERTGDGFRAWFNVIQSTGALRTGLVAADFTVRVVSPNDAAMNSPAVSQSAMKPGLYKFDVPSVFFLANGVGEYGVSVEINTFAPGGSGAPNVRTAFSNVLKLSVEDFDTLPATTTDAVWDEAIAGHLGVGSTGEALNNAATGAPAGIIADAVWDELLAGHVLLGSAGEELAALLDLMENKLTINQPTSELWLWDDAGAVVIKKWPLRDRLNAAVVLGGTGPADRLTRTL